MAILAESDRVLVRDYDPVLDAEQAFQIYGDSEVVRFLGNGQPETNIDTQRETLRIRLERCAAYGDGSGFWAIADKASEDIVGTIILKRLPDAFKIPTSDWEIGWHLRRSAWGKGYATEAAQLVLNYGFNQLDLPVIYAVVNSKNTASIRVTQRLGMTPKGYTTRYYGAELALFELNRNDDLALSLS